MHFKSKIDRWEYPPIRQLGGNQTKTLRNVSELDSVWRCGGGELLQFGFGFDTGTKGFQTIVYDHRNVLALAEL